MQVIAGGIGLIGLSVLPCCPPQVLGINNQHVFRRPLVNCLCMMAVAQRWQDGRVFYRRCKHPTTEKPELLVSNSVAEGVNVILAIFFPEPRNDVSLSYDWDREARNDCTALVKMFVDSQPGPSAGKHRDFPCCAQAREEGWTEGLLWIDE